jgi:hypothetical protein
MSRVKRVIMILAIAVPAAVPSAALAATAPAAPAVRHAPSVSRHLPVLATHTECDLHGQQLCLNDWSSQGVVKMGVAGWPNQYFGWFAVPRCSGSQYVQSYLHGDATNCPFGNAAFDAEFWNDRIVSIWYYPSATRCIGTSGNQTPIIASCPNFSNGSGGSDGTIFVIANPGGCSNDNEAMFVNRAVSDANGNTAFLTSPNSVGGTVYFNANQSEATCWVSADH